MYDNQLTGSIPTTFSMMTQLGSLDLSGNGLSGPLRGHLGDLRSLRSLDLSFNNFVGNVPTELGHLTNLESLSLTSNALLGSIPVEYSRMAKLRELHLSNNNLDGSIVAVASMTDLEWIFLEDNQFTGNLAPTSLLSNLIGVQLQNNRMKGAIPSIWGSIGNLRILDLANNEFSGPIPETVQELHKLGKKYPLLCFKSDHVFPPSHTASFVAQFICPWTITGFLARSPKEFVNCQAFYDSLPTAERTCCANAARLATFSGAADKMKSELFCQHIICRYLKGAQCIV